MDNTILEIFWPIVPMVSPWQLFRFKLMGRISQNHFQSQTADSH